MRRIKVTVSLSTMAYMGDRYFALNVVIGGFLRNLLGVLLNIWGVIIGVPLIISANYEIKKIRIKYPIIIELF